MSLKIPPWQRWDTPLHGLANEMTDWIDILASSHIFLATSSFRYIFEDVSYWNDMQKETTMMRFIYLHIPFALALWDINLHPTGAAAAAADRPYNSLAYSVLSCKQKLLFSFDKGFNTWILNVSDGNSVFCLEGSLFHHHDILRKGPLPDWKICTHLQNL